MCFFCNVFFFAPRFCTKIFRKIPQNGKFSNVSGRPGTSFGGGKEVHVVPGRFRYDLVHGAKSILHLGAKLILHQILHHAEIDIFSVLYQLLTRSTVVKGSFGSCPGRIRVSRRLK